MALSHSTHGDIPSPSRSQRIRNARSKIMHQAHTIINNYNIAPSGSTDSDSKNAFPFGRKEGLLGREQELERLQTFLVDSEEEDDKPRRKVILVQGDIGFGKTQLCLEFANRNRKSFHCWLLPAGSHAEIEGGFADITTALLSTFQEDHRSLPIYKKEDHVEYAKRWLTTHDRWILIFDNANSDIDFESDYFPDTPDGVIIINGRQQRLKTKVKGPVRRILNLQPLSTQGGIDLFKKLLATHEEETVGLQESELIKDIVHKLTGIPQNIELVVAKIRKVGPQIPLQERLRQYRQYLDDLFKGRSPSEYSIVQATQVDQLLDLLESREVLTQPPDTPRVYEDAFTMLQLLSRLGPEPLSVFLLESSWKNWKIAQLRQDPDCRSYPHILKDYETNTFSRHSIQKAINLLDELCLIQITANRDNSEITFNTFIKSCILCRMKSRRIDLYATTLSTLTMLVQSVSWEDDLDQWTHSIRLLPHLRAVSHTRDEGISKLISALCQSDGIDAGLDFALKIGTVYFRGGFLEDAEEIQKLAESKARDILGVYHRITLRAMSEIATSYMINDKPEEALKIRQEVFEIRKIIRQRQLSFRFIVSCVFWNVILALRSSRWPTWRAVNPGFCGYAFEEIMELPPFSWISNTIIQRNLDVIQRNSLAYQQTSMNLADSLAALPSLRDKLEALRIRRSAAYQRLLSVRQNPQASTLDYFQRRIEATRKVASSLRDLRQYRKSFYLRRKIHNICCENEEFKRRSKYPVLTLRVMGDLSESFMDLGNDVAALKLSQNVSDTLKQLVEHMSFPENHVQIIVAERDLGHKYRVMNDLHLAQKLYEDVEEKLLKLFGPHHRLSIDAAENVALIKDRCRNFEDALEKQRAVILEKYKSHGSQSEDLLNSLELAASIVLNEQSLAYLGPKLQYYVVNTRNRQHHKNEISILDSLNHLANCLNSSDEGHYSNIEGDECKLCHEAQYVRSKVLFRQATIYPDGIKHIDTLMTMSGLADDYDMQYEIHIRPEESPQSSQSESREPKVDISISQRDATNSATRDSVQSFDKELTRDLLDEWGMFLKYDCVDTSVFELLATDAPLEPIVSVHQELHISSFDVLKSRSLKLREHILQETIANARVVATNGKDGEDWKIDNRLVSRAERKLAESRSLYGLDTDRQQRCYDKKVSGWLEYVEPSLEGSETNPPIAWSSSPNAPSVKSDIDEHSQDNTQSNECANNVEDDVCDRRPESAQP